MKPMQPPPNNNNNIGSDQDGMPMIWQWQENNGSFHLYNSDVQVQLNNLSIGCAIAIQSGKWVYDVTKTSYNTGNQRNRKTGNVRISKAIPEGDCDFPSPNNINDNPYAFIWQFLENDESWNDITSSLSTKLQNAAVKGIVNYMYDGKAYKLKKINRDKCVQTNVSTNYKRWLRRILCNQLTQERVVWQFDSDNQQNWKVIGNDVMFELQNTENKKSFKCQIRKWNYKITKLDDANAQQENLKTGNVRKYRLIYTDKSSQ